MMTALLRYTLVIAFSFLVLALIALPFLKPGSPSFVADVVGIIMLVALIVAASIVIRRVLRAEGYLAAPPS
ncbi:MAG: hypothetical protein GXO09_05330 [Crenarchaeota archaeon]|nr:hypothetical protein [Thermoproteota archaeon]